MRNEIKEKMVSELGVLLMLITSVNRKLNHATANGYSVQVKTGQFVSLCKFSKDLVNDKGSDVNPASILREFKKITDEIKRLNGLGYAVDISGRRPNGHDSLFLDGMTIKVNTSDYGHDWYTDKSYKS